MAYQKYSEAREVLELRKNDRGDYLKVNVYDKEDKVDIRNYYTNQDGEVLPTQRGVRVSFEDVGSIVEELLKCMEKNEVADLMSSYIAELDSEEAEDIMEDIKQAVNKE